MILVGQYGSPFVRRVAVTLTHYGMAFERQVVSVYGDSVLAAPPKSGFSLTAWLVPPLALLAGAAALVLAVIAIVVRGCKVVPSGSSPSTRDEAVCLCPVFVPIREPSLPGDYA